MQNEILFHKNSVTLSSENFLSADKNICTFSKELVFYTPFKKVISLAFSL